MMLLRKLIKISFLTKTMKKKISLCLWGWGARGFIHIGVLRYLEENGYEIEEVSGTSMWAIVWAAIALGMTADEIYDFVKTEFSYWKLIDFSFWKWVVAGDKLFKKLKEVYGKTKVSATHIPLKIVATDLSDCSMKVFDDGLMLDAVRASLSVPILFKPHIIDWKPYVDGMLSENLPLSVLSWNHIIAVSTAMSLECKYKTTKDIGTKSFNKSLYNNEAISIYKCDKHVELIRPIYDDIDFLDFHKYDKIVKIGYQAAQEYFAK